MIEYNELSESFLEKNESPTFKLRLEARVKNGVLVKAREKLKMTAKEVAKQIGISMGTYHSVENMKNFPSEKIQEKICSFYNEKGYFLLEEDVFPKELKGLESKKQIAYKDIP